MPVSCLHLQWACRSGLSGHTHTWCTSYLAPDIMPWCKPIIWKWPPGLEPWPPCLHPSQHPCHNQPFTITAAGASSVGFHPDLGIGHFSAALSCEAWQPTLQLGSPLLLLPAAEASGSAQSLAGLGSASSCKGWWLNSQLSSAWQLLASSRQGDLHGGH
jgi:hypothetical protein